MKYTQRVQVGEDIYVYPKYPIEHVFRLFTRRL